MHYFLQNAKHWTQNALFSRQKYPIALRVDFGKSNTII